MESLFRASFTTGINKSHQWPYYSTLFQIQSLGTEHLIGLAWVTPVSVQLGGEAFWLTGSLWIYLMGKVYFSPMEKPDAFSRRNDNKCSTSRMLTPSKVSGDQEEAWHTGTSYDFSIKWLGVQIWGLWLSSYSMDIILHSSEGCSQDKMR